MWWRGWRFHRGLVQNPHQHKKDALAIVRWDIWMSPTVAEYTDLNFWRWCWIPHLMSPSRPKKRPGRWASSPAASLPLCGLLWVVSRVGQLKGGERVPWMGGFSSPSSQDAQPSEGALCLCLDLPALPLRSAEPGGAPWVDSFVTNSWTGTYLLREGWYSTILFLIQNWIRVDRKRKTNTLLDTIGEKKGVL